MFQKRKNVEKCKKCNQKPILPIDSNKYRTKLVNCQNNFKSLVCKMSCSIRLTAKIQDISAIRRCLFPTDDQRGSDSWLQLCELSASPTGDLIVVANERKIVVLTSKWNSHSSLSQFEIIYSGSIHEYDKVKAVLCLPIVGQNGSTSIGPDWTCILVAYDSGYVRFYTENCELLMEEQFHIENITNVKCQSQHSPRPDLSLELRPEQIYIQYQSVLCVLNGVQLFPHLRNCRSYLARGETLNLIPGTLTPKKWAFQDQSIIHDSAVVGLNFASTFDHLLINSICGGFEAKYRAMPSHSTLVVAAGSKPFLGYHYALEGIPQPVFSDIAKAVTNKLKSALPGWLTGGRSQPEKPMSLAMQPSDAMGCRFGLCDLRRTATEIILSPDHKLAAVCDALGRVLLIDSYRGVTLRIFKGYRDAQCSFVQVPDERRSRHRIGQKVAHFLLIYSPKKGTLEVFSVQQGNRIATFNASKYSRLMYINYNLMGFIKNSKSKYVCQFTTVFIDNDGQIKEVLVPFHFALTEKNNKRARDIHLYKKLRQLIKSGNFEEGKLSDIAYNTCTELKTIEIKSQVIEMLLNSKNVPALVILRCVQYFLEHLSEEEGANLKVLCGNVSSLLQLYLFVTHSSQNNNLDKENGNLDQYRNITLNLEAKEMRNLQKLLDLSTLNDNNKLPEIHVSFSDNVNFTVAEFLSTFDLTSPNYISLKQAVDESILFRTSEVLFKPYVISDLRNLEEIQQKIISSKINIRNLFHMLINYWVNKSLHIDLNLEKEMNNLSMLIYTLAKIAKKEITGVEYAEISEFWLEIRDILANSARPFPALVAAILCKNIAHKFENIEDSSCSFPDESMEVLTIENIEWSLLIGKLEDVSLLNIILSTRILVNKTTLPKLKHDKVDISLRYVLVKGRGSVSELVARWLTTSGIDPQSIILNDRLRQHNTDDEDEEEEVIVYKFTEDEKKIFEQLNLLREQFPYSLEGSILLSNMAWEYALAWQKDIQNLGNLEAAIKCLSLVQNLQVKQGLYQLMWNTHLKIVYESACKLINKVGKLPKDRLCKQDTGLMDYQVILFIGITTDFFDAFLDAAHDSVNSPKTTLKYENIWENGGSQPLVELAAQQREVNYSLLHLHYQLSMVLQMIATFSIKHTKPVSNLFEASMGNMFFTDLQRKFEINWNKSDIKINSSRTHFLFKIISASMETVTVQDNNQIYSKEHVVWMAKAIMLGRIWNLEIDVLRRYQVVRLYASGFDLFAAELMPAINNRRELGVHLLKVGAKRLKLFMASSPYLTENIAALSPYLTNYMESLDSEWCASTPLPTITNLAIHALHCLDEDQSEFKLAQLLLDGCNTLEEMRS